MGLFRRTKVDKNTDINAPRAPISMVDPSTLYHKTADLQNELTTLLRQYESLASGNNNLKLEQYQLLLNNFKGLATQFENVYEIMKFDTEKLEEIRKYHEKSQKKRQELVRQLTEEEKELENKLQGKNPDEHPKKQS